MTSVGCRLGAKWTQRTEGNICRNETFTRDVHCFRLKELHDVEETEGFDESEATPLFHFHTLQIVTGCYKASKPYANCWARGGERKWAGPSSWCLWSKERDQY